jgi:hypothetical protein
MSKDKKGKGQKKEDGKLRAKMVLQALGLTPGNYERWALRLAITIDNYNCWALRLALS